VAGSLGYNQLAGNTVAGGFGTNRNSSLTLSGDLTATAENDQTLKAYGVSIGVTTAAQATALALTIRRHILPTRSSVFSRANAIGLVAEILNATVKSTAGKVSLLAKDNSYIEAIGGGLAIGARSGNAYGFGVGWNQVAVNADAEINNATVNAFGNVS